MPSSELAVLEPELREVSLKSGDVTYSPGDDISHVYFPTTCVLSVLMLTRDGSGVEIATIGREGLSDSLAISLGSVRAPSQTLCQIPGNAKILPVDVFQKSIGDGNALRALTQRYARSSVALMGQSVACNRLHTLTERCARWLLLTHDRVASDQFTLTQEFLAAMLGVHRPAVSVAAGTLQQAGFIQYRRGHVTIIDRDGLESASCECYKVAMGQLNGA